MLYRAAAMLIVVFWIAMSTLLIRDELSPGATKLKEVPVSVVTKLMFQHGQASDLNVHSDRHMVGELRFHPQVRTNDGVRLLEYSGRLLLALPGALRQRVAWTGAIEMNPALEMQSARLQFQLSDPAAYTVKLLVDPRAKRLFYETQSGARTLEHGSYPLDANGATMWLREQGIDPALIQNTQTATAPQPTFRAWKSSMQIHGQRLETYRVALEHGGQTLLEFQVNQIGQILHAKTFLGYTAAPEDVIP